MSTKGGVPDAWDDDWESLADVRGLWLRKQDHPMLTVYQKQEPTVDQTEQPAPKLTKAQRRAQHLEQQRQLWDSAENPARFHWLETQGVVPLKQEFKPQVTLLARKPNAPTIAKKDAAADGVAKLSIDDQDDSEEEDRKKREADLEERQRKAKIEREEKQRKYAEARERIMGSSSPASPAPTSRESSHGRDNRRSRGKMNGKRDSQPTSSADQSPARLASGADKQLFDPEDMGRRQPKRESTPVPKEEQPLRQPRGPESAGRGGFGFAGRGGRLAS